MDKRQQLDPKETVAEEIAFEQLRLTGPMYDRQFIDCTFTRCVLEQAQLTNCRFEQCAFVGCELTLTELPQTRLGEVRFDGCKLTGIDFSQCNPFLLRLGFSRCVLDSCGFSEMKLAGMDWGGSALRGCDFIRTDLTGANFTGCALTDTLFDDSCLVKADFSNATDYAIDVRRNRVNKAIFSYPEALRLLAGLGVVVRP
ncbi:MAG: pentapeptide repeat-containing protein [Christensenellales bacterium]|jgi:fluoroquinolone resistance protein